ncbi:hypothetical protein [Microbulbifer discodermiae]|uniref:hypothetical protein n=1 Tax=Microbulbifer sp. 2201CG32-9 TaxID=3232309 RepID=UPI00345B7A4D
MDKDTFAQNLAFELKRREMEKAELARQCGLSRAFIFEITRKKNPQNSSLDSATAIATTLKLPLFLFFLPSPLFQRVVSDLPENPKQKVTVAAVLKAVLGYYLRNNE